jgi:LuxR family maltose regulon positive regulatory protein
MHTGLAEVEYQRGRLAEAKAHIETGRRLGAEFAFPRDPYRSRVVRARILQADGDVDAAVTLLDEAERLYVSDFSPDVRPISAIRARLLIAHGRLAEARAWARAQEPSSAERMGYIEEFAQTTLARLHVAQATDGDQTGLAPAIELLEHLAAAAEAGHRDGSRLEILITLALARHAAGDPSGAMAALDTAITLAEPEGYRRVFLDEGPAMLLLLRVAARRSGGSGFVGELLRVAETGAADRPPASQGLVEPLSERELVVLRLLRSELDGPDIARELVVSLNTLRTHTKHIYAKLGVSSRRAAIRRAEELRLF